MLSLRATLGLSAGLGVLIAATAVAVLIRHNAGTGSLHAEYSTAAVCYQPPKPADWQNQADRGLVFGLDVLSLSSDSAHVTVTSAEAINAVGGIVVDKVEFVPGAEVSIATSADRGVVRSNPILQSLTRSLPAHLRSTPWPAGVDDGFRPTDWELAAFVRAPVSSTRAALDGFRLTYSSGATIRTITTHESITLGTGKDVCRH